MSENQTETETTPIIPDSDQKQEEIRTRLAEATTKFSKMSFSIWPPSKRTREAVITRLIHTLSEKSVLSDRYGIIPEPEARDIAEKIEEEAFDGVGDADDFKAAAGKKGEEEEEDLGLVILQCYSQEISKRMLEFVKARSAADDTVMVDEEVDVKEEEAVASDVET